jgi:hypothetical protein
MNNQITLTEISFLQKHLQAFNFNFKSVSIMKYHKIYYVFQDQINETEDNYIYKTDNIDHLNGWLYGAVMAKCKQIKWND